MSITGLIHVGAHTGQEDSCYKGLNIAKRIYFEPVTSNYNRLIHNIQSPAVAFNVALGNVNRRMRMNIDSENDGMSSSLLKPKRHLIAYPQIRFNSTQEVDVRRLDDLGLDLGDVNCLIMDVQGYELEVLRGAKDSLKHMRYIISEINKQELYVGCAQLGELVLFLADYGFVLAAETWAGAGWGDGLFIRQ